MCLQAQYANGVNKVNGADKPINKNIVSQAQPAKLKCCKKRQFPDLWSQQTSKCNKVKPLI